MNAFVNAAPLANLLGIQDNSGRPPVIDPEVLPSHLPLVYLYTEKGPTIPQLVAGDTLNTIFGAKTLDPRSPYYNHQSVLANALQGAGNAIFVQRVVPANAGPKARLLLSVDIVADNIPQFERNADGSFRRDANGARIPDGTPKAGHKLKWVLNDWNSGGTPQAFGAVTSKAGSITGAGAAQSTVYPIMELEVSFVGGYGNNLGLRLMAPTTISPAPTNDTLAEAVKAFMYRLQLVQRTDAASTPTPIETLQGEQFLDFALSPSAYDRTTDRELSAQSLILQSYQDLDSPGFPPTYGPFGRMHIYRSNLQQVLAMIGAAEAPEGLLPTPTMNSTSEFLYMVNPFTGTDLNGVPYYTLEVQGPADGGMLFGETSTHYAAGGSDGTMSNAAFDTLVRDQLLNFGEGEADLLDWAMYPLSTIYDTGFSMDTKMAMLTPIGKRKDVWVALSTQDITQDQNTAAEETSIATALRTAARNYPESIMYGTSVCRAIVIGHSGYLINDPYKGLLPLTIEFATKCARFMSAGNGVWRRGLGFDVPPNNQISMFRGVNVTFKPAITRAKDWNIGLVWVQNYDRRTLFWPAVQTVYEDDSSVLNAAINMFVAVELEKVAQRAWRDLTGISNLTAEQFVERSNRLITQMTQGRFDDRVIIRPNTFYTAADEQRGYSWSCRIDMFAPNMKTVGTYTVRANRISDLNQGP